MGAYMWRSEVSSVKLILSFSLCVASRDQTQVLDFSGKCFNPVIFLSRLWICVCGYVLSRMCVWCMYLLM